MTTGHITLIYGSMKSGKTSRLIAEGGKDAVFFTPSLKEYYDNYKILTSRDGSVVAGFQIPYNNPTDILTWAPAARAVLCIDEAQFFTPDLLSILERLRERCVTVFLAGLDTDFRGRPFGIMPTLKAEANTTIRLYARCDVAGCNKRGAYNQRLVDGLPAPGNSPQIVLKDEAYYEVRCAAHFQRGV